MTQPLNQAPQPCPQCHRPMSARGCYYCGTAGHAPTAPSMPAYVAPPPTFPWVWAILAFLVPIAGLVAGVWQLRAGTAEQSQAGKVSLIGAAAGFICGWIFLSLALMPSGGGSGAGLGIGGGSASGLQVESASFQAAALGGQVVGTVYNPTDRTFSYAQVEINLYDAAGNQVGSTLANINNLEPHGRWAFSAPVLEPRTASWKLKGITAW